MKQAVKVVIVITIVLSLGFLFAADYVGSAACQGCHGAADLSGVGYNIYENWQNTGHPYKANIVENNEAPTYPNFVTNFESDWMTGLGSTWDNIALVIGGFGWKARFVDKDGHIAGTASSLVNPSAGHNQFNFFGGVDRGWVDYDPDVENKDYNYGCFKCHTTGPTPEGSWIADKGLGDFTEGGIGCEGCHGPGSDHVAGPTTENISRHYINDTNDGAGLDYAGKGGRGVIMPGASADDVVSQCGACHNRSWAAPINASGGFVKHHEQWDEFVASEHFEDGLTCLTCHDPHKRVIWDGDGITKTCESCHEATEEKIINHEGTHDCIDCHMPFAAKSGAQQGVSGYQGDVRSHIFKITVKDESMFTADGANVRDDADRRASYSLEYSCLGCHNADPNDEIPDKTLAEALTEAEGMHEESLAVNGENAVPGSFKLYQNHPNPFNPSTMITFDLDQDQNVFLAVYNLMGQEVAVLNNNIMTAGSHSLNWNGLSDSGELVNSGVYIAKLTTQSGSQSVKMIYMK